MPKKELAKKHIFVRLCPGRGWHTGRGKEPVRLGCKQALGRTPFKSWGDYEDVCCRLSTLIKLMELASWPASSTGERKQEKRFQRKSPEIPFRSAAQEIMGHQ